MDDVSNRTLALLLVTAIVVSLGATVYTLNVLSGVRQLPTGRAPSGTGEVNLTVESAISIVLWNNTIDFGLGYVNNTKGCQDANLSIEWAGLTYTDENDCWTGQYAAPNQPTHPFTIENDGNQNVTLTIQGPTPLGFFDNEPLPSQSHLFNLSWKGDNMNGGDIDCSSGLVESWTTFDGTLQTVCPTDYFGFVGSADDLAVDIKVQIPGGVLTPGEMYFNDTITFTAS